MVMKKAFISLGSNVGDRKKNLGKAIRYINVSVGHIIDLSGIYETEPWGFESDEKFLNMVVEVISDLSPFEMMRNFLEIEKKLGRERFKSERYTSRTIDIDLLFYQDLIITEPELTVPHPHLHLRRFVLEPLCQIDPDYIHPVFGKTVTELLANCPDEGEVTQLGSMMYDF
jgi:2-amino-4-hydroxy-6-hydroxymethyldihydropteridine diphosphokinase